MIINVMANALKFTSKGGTVSVRAHAMGGAVEFAVSDTGIGMSAGDIELALERFKQVDGSHTRKYGGTGLGFPIAKSLVELQGGTFSIVSAPGVGTTVTFRLPQAASGDGLKQVA